MKEFRYQIIDGQGDSDPSTLVDCIDLIQQFNTPCDYVSYEEAKTIIEGRWHKLHIGTDEDNYEIVRLDEPMVHNEFGELVTLSEHEDEIAYNDDMAATVAHINRNIF